MVPHLGVDNPLTAIDMFSDFSGSDGDGTERASDVDMEEGRVREKHRQLHTSLMLSVYFSIFVLPVVLKVGTYLLLGWDSWGGSTWIYSC